MRYLQINSFDEYLHGSKVVQVVITDHYDEIIPIEPMETIESDIIQLETVKQDLNADDGKFAIDELKFSINHLACHKQTDLDLMYFCLDATNMSITRYIAIFFGEIELDNLLL